MLPVMKRLVELSHGTFDSALPVENFVACIVVQSIGPVKHEVSVPFHDSQVKGKALLIQTGWDQHWGNGSYWETGPTLAESLIFRLVRSEARILGVDFCITGPSGGTQLLVGGKIPIVENLRDLPSLPRWGFRFGTAPARPAGGSTLCPVRAFAEIAL